MPESNTVVRSVHDLGLAVWCGGSLMGAIGLNGPAANATERRERLTPSPHRWAPWSPVAVTANGVHPAGGIHTADKAALTGVAMAGTASSASMGRQVTQLPDAGAPGATETRARHFTGVDVGAKAVARVSVGQPGPDRWTRGTGRATGQAAVPRRSAGLSLVAAAL